MTRGEYKSFEDAVSPEGARASGRTIALALGIVFTSAFALRALGDDRPVTAALKVVWPALTLAIVPGALITLLWRPRSVLTMFEVIGFGTAVSFGLVHLATVFAVSTHLSAAIVIGILATASIVLVAAVARRPTPIVVAFTLDEGIVLVLLAVFSAFLYLQGSPTDSFEDQVHIAIARRLAYLEHPRLDNLYFAPGIVYTYPFPGTHYFIGLIARLGDIDALFLYHKLRFLWGPLSIVLLHLTARVVFGSRAVAAAVAVTGIVLAAAGVFGQAEGFPWGWGQLATFSHVSDVAMTVLLPALMVVTFEAIHAESRRATLFFVTSATLLVFMLTVVHIREVMQFAVYLGSFLVVAASVPRFRPYLGRAASMVAVTIAIAVLYGIWQRQAVLHIATLVVDERARLLAIAQSATWRALLFAPASQLLSHFIPSAASTFAGLTPFFLFAGPVVIVLFRSRPLVWMISASTAMYLAVMSIPALAIAYIYATYSEILITPIRNVIFFVYLFAGALAYAIVLALTRIDRTRLTLVIAGIALGLLGLLYTLTSNRSGRGFFLPLVTAYALTFVLPLVWARRRRLAKATIGLVALAAGGAVAMMWPDHAAPQPAARINVRWRTDVSDAQRGALEKQLALVDGQPTPDYTDELKVLTYTLTDLSIDRVRQIVQHPAVLDTQHVDRATFTVQQQPPQTTTPIASVEHFAWLQYPGTVTAAATSVVVWSIAILVPVVVAWRSRGDDAGRLPPGEPFFRHAAAYALFVIPFTLWSVRPTQSPLSLAPMGPFGRVATPRELTERTPCATPRNVTAPFSEDVLGPDGLTLPDRPACPPDDAVMKWVARHVPPEAVFAIDRWNPYLPSVYVPQQVVAMSQVERVFVNERELFRSYYAFFDDRLRKYRVQPFFNNVETAQERDAFVDGLGVTHVLVDPAYYDELLPVLDRLPHRFERQYAHANWAVYRVKRETSAS